MAGMTATCNSIFRPDRLERSSGTVNVPHCASICFPEGGVSGQSSNVIKGFGVGAESDGEHEARMVRSRREAMKIRLIVFLLVIDVCSDCNR